MKEKIHPPYQEVLFIDSATGKGFVCRATLQPKEKKEFEGKQYPVYYVSTSSFSHPFFNEDTERVNTEGRVGQFQKKYMKKQQEEAAKKKVEPATPAKGAKKVTRKK